MRAVKAVPDASAALSPAESKLLDELRVATRSPTFLGRFMQAFQYATRTVTRREFDVVCQKVCAEIDGTTATQDEAVAKAIRLIKAHTQAHAGAILPKCDYSDRAILVAWLGDPQSGFLFQKAITLKDPKGVKLVH